MIRSPVKVALYARFSSDNQRSESIDAQIRAMKDYCARNNYIIVETYVDEARSATTDRRPAFQQMIADSSKHNFDVVLVHKLDRFARNRYDSAVYKRELKKNGVTVYSVLENLDNSPESIMMEAVLEGMSEYYSQNLAREVMKGMRETALQGKHTGGIPPLGYDVDHETQRLIINEKEAETVRLIYRMFVDGCTYKAIIATLNETGAMTKIGEPFKKGSLYSILSNPKYSGLYVFNLRSAKSAAGTRNNHLHKASEEIITIEDGCPRIIDQETFEQAQKRLQENKHSGMRHHAKENYLLSGKVFCRECGKPMVGNSRVAGRSKLKYVTYRCLNKKTACSNKEINKEVLDSYVVAMLEKNIFNGSALKANLKRIEKAAQDPRVMNGEEELKKELEEIDLAITNVADAVAAGLLSDALIDRLNELEGQKHTVEEKLKQIRLYGKRTVSDPTTILAHYNELKGSPALPAYKEMVRSFVTRIEVGRYAVGITLKTGLGVNSNLDRTFIVRREEIYQSKKAVI